RQGPASAVSARHGGAAVVSTAGNRAFPVRRGAVGGARVAGRCGPARCVRQRRRRGAVLHEVRVPRSRPRDGPPRSADLFRGAPAMTWTDSPMRWLVSATALVLFVTASPRAQPPQDSHVQRGREILKELIETNTTQSTGSVTVASERMAKRLLAA